MRTRNRPPLWLLAAPVVGALALGIVSVGVSVSGGDGGWYGIAAAALYAVAVVVTWLWDRPRRRSDSLRVRHDPTPHPVDLWLADPDEHDGHLVAVSYPWVVTLRAPDGTTHPLRHVGGGVYEEAPCES
jgi:hypothetical protein